MTQYLYSGFLFGLEEYEAAEFYWRKIWKAVERRSAKGQCWYVCVPNILADGTREREGNPIFWALCEGIRRSVRIIQSAPDQDYLDLSAWLSKFGGDESGAPFDELVIHCTPSLETEGFVIQLLEVFMDSDADPNEIENKIKRIVASSRGNAPKSMKSRKRPGI